MKKCVFILTTFIVALFLFSARLWAWDGVTTGYIGSIEVTGAENFAFRIHMDDEATFCGTADWAYIDKSSDNYEAYVNALLTAKSTNSLIRAYTIYDDSGRCQIQYLVVYKSPEPESPNSGGVNKVVRGYVTLSKGGAPQPFPLASSVDPTKSSVFVRGLLDPNAAQQSTPRQGEGVICTNLTKNQITLLRDNYTDEDIHVYYEVVEYR